MLLTWDNRFDWKSFWICIGGAIVQTFVYIAIILAFKASRLSGLNIGIIESLWSIAPFFVALTEWILHRVGIKLYQFLGMLGLVTMAILISLADLFTKEAEELEIVGELETKLPVYKALLLCLVYPCAVVTFVELIKIASQARLNLIDWSMAYFFISSVFLIVPSIFVFISNKDSFSLHYFVQGFIASICACIAATLADFALGLKDAPQGPSVALLNVRTVIVLIVDSILNRFMLSSMQWIGLVIGIISMLIITIPD